MFTSDAQPGLPYWWDGAPEPDATRHDLPAKAELVIIGAGLTGLSAAIIAARRGVDVVVLDAGQPGQGASTRNGGMFGAIPRLDYGHGRAVHGAEVTAALHRETPQANRWTAEMIARESIACDFQRTGRIDLAYTPDQFAAQQADFAHMQGRSDERVALIQRADLPAHINTDCYFGGILLKDHAAVNPRKYHDGMLRVAQAAGARVIARCPVTAISTDPGHHRLTTPLGTISAARLILATNGYTSPVTPWVARRIFGLPSFIIATELLPDGMADRLAPGRRMMVETRKRHSYYRLSPDGTRILFGGRAYMTPAGPDRAAARLRETMVEIWPETAALKLSHSWFGYTGFTFAQTPHLGCHEGMHFALGYSGSGIALAPYLGMKAALQALGDPDGATAFAQTRFDARLWFRGGRPHFLRLANLWFRFWTDRRETARAKTLRN